MSKTTFSSKSTNLTTATTAATTTSATTGTNPGGSTHLPATKHVHHTQNHTDLDNISRYRESPSWMGPYYVPERVKDREGHQRRIGEVIKGVEGVLGKSSSH
ncbi:hypothetical protein BBP40_005008 [Aspergillus hancockii]|nr:hypothetical protein BBP40_005008 [Aspergillus hancockii]